MPTLEQENKFVNQNEIYRFIINGIVATGIHYCVLTTNIEVFKIESAGLANLLAATFGITASFIGNRYFVYKGHSGTLIQQASKFGLLYILIAILNGMVLFVWADLYGLSYHLGFIVATILQTCLSYLGNKKIVFKT